MIFIETPIFTEDVITILPDEDLRQLQNALSLNPELGALITGSGGLRKVRWNTPGTGKRGGARIIYYWVVAKDIVYMLLIYKKSRRENLTDDQLAVLKALVKEEFK